MILVDTNVWINHLRDPHPMLRKLLGASKVLMHPMVLGELACGRFKNHGDHLRSWRNLPRIEARDHAEVIGWIEAERLAGAGIGFIDAHLLHAVVVQRGSRLWTADRSLRSLAARFGAVFPRDDT